MWLSMANACSARTSGPQFTLWGADGYFTRPKPCLPPSRLRKKLVRRRVSSALTPFENCPVRGGTARRAPRGFGSTPPSPTEWSCRLRRQVADPDQVVDGHSEDEHPADSLRPPMARLAEQAGRLEPAEDLLDELPLSLAHDVAGVARGAAIDRTRTIRGVLGHVRRHLQPAQTSHEIPGVIPFVGAQRDPAGAREGGGHGERRLSLGVPRCGCQARIHRQAMTVLHQDVTLVAQLGLVRLALAGQPRLGVGRRGMGGVAARLAVEVHSRIARVVGRLARRVLALEALQPGPRLNERAVYGEVLLREQRALRGLGPDLVEERSEEHTSELQSPCNL